MSVCVSVASAGVSVVLNKYTGNVWLQKTFKQAHEDGFAFQQASSPYRDQPSF